MLPLLGPGDVVVQVGPFARKRAGGRTVRVASLRVYSKQTPLAGNACGGGPSTAFQTVVIP